MAILREKTTLRFFFHALKTVFQALFGVKKIIYINLYNKRKNEISVFFILILVSLATSFLVTFI